MGRWPYPDNKLELTNLLLEKILDSLNKLIKIKEYENPSECCCVKMQEEKYTCWFCPVHGNMWMSDLENKNE